MPDYSDTQDLLDPFGIAASMGEWCCLLKAAQELKDVDEEMITTMLEANASGSASEADRAVKIGSIVNLMRSLKLDPDVVRRHDPAAMRELEETCLRCTQRGRCVPELWTGNAAETYPEFCPNKAHLDRLRHAKAMAFQRTQIAGAGVCL
ncbi:DUF6455 family protein [Methylorubrum rhodesianum]|uniref:DUF6455 family protein n=1 Tax=Methylorubrum rhodesianum TaxID=29427 RepID=UPI003D093BC8